MRGLFFERESTGNAKKKPQEAQSSVTDGQSLERAGQGLKIAASDLVVDSEPKRASEFTDFVVGLHVDKFVLHDDAVAIAIDLMN
ncbi:hypothetical protein BH10BDE1_BH10BDE1_30400 [soil metagenome]